MISKFMIFTIDGGLGTEMANLKEKPL